MAVSEVLADSLKLSALILSPNLLVERWRGSPRVRKRKKRSRLTLAVGVDEAKQHALPLVQVGKDVAQVFVPRPVGFFTDLGDAGIKMRMLIVGTHALNEAVQFRILRLGGIQ